MSVVQARVAAFGGKRSSKQTDKINLYYNKLSKYLTYLEMGQYLCEKHADCASVKLI